MSFSCIKPVVHSLFVVQLFVTPWTSACQAPCPSPTPELAQTQVRPVSDAIQLSHPLSSPSPPAFNLSQLSGSFPMSWLFASGGQSIGASASVLPVNIQDWFLLELTRLILQSKGTLKSSPTPQFKTTNSSVLSLYGPPLTSIHDYWKNHTDLCWQVRSLLFNMLSRFVVAFLPRSIF